jgi:hypothetical protein
VMSPNTETTALLLVPSGFVVLNKTLGSGDADGIRFSVLPVRATPRQAMVQVGRAFLQACSAHDWRWGRGCERGQSSHAGHHTRVHKVAMQ